MTCILVASDLSERSDRAVRRALRLGAGLGLPVRVVTIVDDDIPAELREAKVEKSRILLDRFVESQIKQGQAAETEVRLGHAATTVPAIADEVGAELLILGLHRPRPILDALRGTTMERIVRATSRPVLLVRDAADHDYDKVLVPVSFSPACAAAVRAAHRVAPEAELRLFHALHIPFAGYTGDDALARAVESEVEALSAAWIDRYGLPEDVERPRIVRGGVIGRLEAQIQSFAPDLLAMGAHTRPSLAPYALGAIAADMIRTPPCDLLLTRPAKGES